MIFEFNCHNMIIRSWKMVNRFQLHSVKYRYNWNLFLVTSYEVSVFFCQVYFFSLRFSHSALFYVFVTLNVCFGWCYVLGFMFAFVVQLQFYHNFITKWFVSFNPCQSVAFYSCSCGLSVWPLYRIFMRMCLECYLVSYREWMKANSIVQLLCMLLFKWEMYMHANLLFRIFSFDDDLYIFVY